VRVNGSCSCTFDAHTLLAVARRCWCQSRSDLLGVHLALHCSKAAKGSKSSDGSATVVTPPANELG